MQYLADATAFDDGGRMEYSTFMSRNPFARGVEVLDLMATDPLGRWVRSMTVSDVGGRRGERESSMAIDSRSPIFQEGVLQEDLCPWTLKVRVS